MTFHLALIEKHELAFPHESFGQISDAGKALLRGLTTALIRYRVHMRDDVKKTSLAARVGAFIALPVAIVVGWYMVLVL